jgi:shikimate dehydrogenase
MSTLPPPAIRCKFGLLGHPLEHSLSPLIHHHLMELSGLSGTYELLDRDLPALESGAISQFIMEGIQGFNVTIPYKVLMYSKLKALTPMAKRVGAVNTVMIFDVEDHVTLIGHNTDATGFFKSLPKETRQRLADGKVLMLGAGGAARAVLAALAFENTDSPADVFMAMRNPEKSRPLVELWESWRTEAPKPLSTLTPLTLTELDEACLANIDVVINTTPLGMHPHPNALPLPLSQLQQLPQHTHVIDLIYNPGETLLMKEARNHGCPVVINGLGMLVHQAIEAFCSWTKLPPKPTWAKQVMERLEASHI